MRFIFPGAAALILITACTNGQIANGPASDSRATTSPPTFTPWPVVNAGPCAPALPAGSPPRMAVLESTPPGPFHGKVVIAGLDAVGVARATFQVRNEFYSYAGPGQAIYPPKEAYAIRGTVYFIDGYGTVFRMGIDGNVEIAAKFPIGLHQQEVSFAVSPDGCQLAAAVLTMPTIPLTPYGEPDINPPGSILTGAWKLETMKASFGGSTDVLQTWTSDKAPNSPGGFENIVLQGWDEEGPIAVAGSNLTVPSDSYGTPIANADFYGGRIVHLAADGTVGEVVSVPGCAPLKVSPQGDIVCLTLTPDRTSIRLGVITTAGRTELSSAVYNLQAEGLYDFSSPFVAVGQSGLLAVSGQFSHTGSATTSGLWRSPDGSQGDLQAMFDPQGWIDRLTVFGRDLQMQTSPSAGGDAALIHIGPSQQVEDLQFAGDFVGMLS